MIRLVISICYVYYTDLLNYVLLSALVENYREVNMKIVVIGAGAFGGWTALHLVQNGADVTLIDTWGPGNSRASSGGETRIIRSVYHHTVYTEFNVRALELWHEADQKWGTELFHKTGLLWLLTDDEVFAKDSLNLMRSLNMNFKDMTVKEAEKFYPQICFDGITFVVLEEHAGYLLARHACEVVWKNFLRSGGKYIRSAVKPVQFENNSITQIELSGGSLINADMFVFACGPWLGSLFPDLLNDLIIPTRQEAYYFGTFPGDTQYEEDSLPVWFDQGDGKTFSYYGIPGNSSKGFKIANDIRGEVFDPTYGDRMPSEEGIDAARNYIRKRFPGMDGAPLIETRVCQYENTPDHHFIIDRHPESENVFVVGGGSGHGFKHGPVVGEYVARSILKDEPLNPLFLLNRFHKEQ